MKWIGAEGNGVEGNGMDGNGKERFKIINQWIGGDRIVQERKGKV